MRALEDEVLGIFLAGAAQAPKDIPDTVAQAKGAAAAAAVPLAQGRVKIDPIVSEVVTEQCSESVQVCRLRRVIGLTMQLLLRLVQQGVEAAKAKPPEQPNSGRAEGDTP